jgi:choline-phosphate cytidylyltransferase
MRQLEQAKKAFPDVYLIVGVTGDKETHERKGLTVLSGAERAESVRHCKWVDEVFPNCPWIVTPEFMEEHKIDYVAHDDLPYGAAEGDDIYAPIKAQGKFLVTQRTEGVSTTGVITRSVCLRPPVISVLTFVESFATTTATSLDNSNVARRDRN